MYVRTTPGVHGVSGPPHCIALHNAYGRGGRGRGATAGADAGSSAVAQYQTLLQAGDMNILLSDKCASLWVECSMCPRESGVRISGGLVLGGLCGGGLPLTLRHKELEVVVEFVAYFIFVMGWVTYV